MEKTKKHTIHQNVKQIYLYQMEPCLHVYILHSVHIQQKTSTTFSRVLRDSMTCYVGQSVGLSVGRSASAFFSIYGRFLRYCSCPIAQIAFFITAPTHPHATSVAVYTALLFEHPISGKKRKNYFL